MSLILDKKTKSDKKAKLQKIAKTAPQKPGIYFWYGKNQEIIYVGRANNLRARLGQYFQSQVEPKTKEMVSLAHNLKFLEKALDIL